MRIEKKSLATVALTTAVLLLSVMMISLLLLTPRSIHEVSSVSVQAQLTAQPTNEISALPAESPLRPAYKINTNSAPIIEIDAEAEEPPEATIDASAVFSISGTVLNPQGEWLTDIEISATPRRVYATENDEMADTHRTTSELDGRYRFDGLIAGDYRIRTSETSLYASAAVSVSAGSDAVNLVLAPRQDLWIYGVVKDNADLLLSDVRIVPNRDTVNATYSDAQGSFGLYHTLHRSARPHESLLFSKDGYHDKQVVLQVNDPYAIELPVADVRLQRIEGLANVRGTVSADDAPVPRARVFLSSTKGNASYDTTTDAGGYFALPDVVIGHYELSVVPQGTHQDHTEGDIIVSASGLELSIALEPLQSGRLRGHMVDVEGQPVPNVRLWLTNLSARSRGARPFSGDAQGNFDVESLPTGELRLTTHSVPRIRLTGVTVTGENDSPIRLTLDVGDNTLEVNVIDSYTNAVPGAQVSVVWSHEDNGVSSHAVRNSISDASGFIRFSQLGPGMHTLNVSAPGFQRRRIDHDVGVGGEVRIELQARASGRSQ